MARAANDRGFSLVEVLVATLVLTIGIGATVASFASSKHAQLVTQRHEVAIHQAQKAMEDLRSLPYANLKMTGAAAYTGDASHTVTGPGSSLFDWKAGTSECLVLSTLTACNNPVPSGTAKVSPGPDVFKVTTSSGVTVKGNIYRYVTWRDEICPAPDCSGTQNTKRLVVGVALDNSGNLQLGLTKPIWISSIAIDPNDAKGCPCPSSASPSKVTGQTFFLYDKACGLVGAQTDTYTSPTVDHYTNNTAAYDSPTSANDSFCGNAITKRPDLMGSTPPSGSTLYNYSADYAGGGSGLATKRLSSSCDSSIADHSYPSTPADANGPTGRFRVHAWSTGLFKSDFRLKGNATVSIHTSTVGGASGSGKLCAFLVARNYTSGTVSDTVLGSYVYDNPDWPTTSRRLTFTFPLGNGSSPACASGCASSTPNDPIDGNPYWPVPACSGCASPTRLMLVLSVRQQSGADLNFLYDDTSHPSFLQVSTTTPCNYYAPADPCA